MANTLGMAAQLAGNGARFGWYYGVNALAERQASRIAKTPRYRPEGPVPTRAEMLRDLADLFLADARAVRDGLYPPTVDEARRPGDQLARLRRMLADLPGAIARREAQDATSARDEAGADELPAYFTQDFHYQAGGYLSDESAALYDVQVETLFYGSANAMRRAALRPIAEAIRGRDQRQLALVDVACGTGRFLRQVRLAFPALQLRGLDLSRAYLDEAARHLRGVRPVELIAANAEAMPLADGSQDLVTCVFLFHELPRKVRRTVASEIGRVLKPGGRAVFVDSLQRGDRPGWDGLLEAFPKRFHEPYFDDYVADDLESLLAKAGLMPVSSATAFLSKVVTVTRP